MVALLGNEGSTESAHNTGSSFGQDVYKRQITSLYAEYGYYMTLINIPLTLASTAPTSMIPEVSAQYAKRLSLIHILY